MMWLSQQQVAPHQTQINSVGLNKNNNGFTLIEIVVVLLIVGLLLAGSLGSLSARVEQSERQQAEAQLEHIRDALLGFAITEGRLPCPDTSGDGNQNYSGGTNPPDHTCAATHGELPWRDLHVSEFDPWRNHFIFHISDRFADGYTLNTFSPPAACVDTPSLGVSFALCSLGNIEVRSGAAVTPAVMNFIPVIVLSKGKHNLPAEDSVDEQENGLMDTDRIFVSRQYSQSIGNEFDDLMIWISPNILKNRMVQAGRLP